MAINKATNNAVTAVSCLIEYAQATNYLPLVADTPDGHSIHFVCGVWGGVSITTVLTISFIFVT